MPVGFPDQHCPVRPQRPPGRGTWPQGPSSDLQAKGTPASLRPGGGRPATTHVARSRTLAARPDAARPPKRPERRHHHVDTPRRVPDGAPGPAQLRRSRPWPHPESGSRPAPAGLPARRAPRSARTALPGTPAKAGPLLRQAANRRQGFRLTRLDLCCGPRTPAPRQSAEHGAGPSHRSTIAGRGLHAALARSSKGRPGPHLPREGRCPVGSAGTACLAREKVIRPWGKPHARLRFAGATSTPVGGLADHPRREQTPPRLGAGRGMHCVGRCAQKPSHGKAQGSIGR